MSNTAATAVGGRLTSSTVFSPVVLTIELVMSVSPPGGSASRHVSALTGVPVLNWAVVSPNSVDHWVDDRGGMASLWTMMSAGRTMRTLFGPLPWPLTTTRMVCRVTLSNGRRMSASEGTSRLVGKTLLNFTMDNRPGNGTPRLCVV